MTSTAVDFIMLNSPLEQFDISILPFAFNLLEYFILFQFYIEYLLFIQNYTKKLTSIYEKWLGIKHLSKFFILLSFPFTDVGTESLFVFFIFSFFFRKYYRQKIPFFMTTVTFIFIKLLSIVNLASKDNLYLKKRACIYLMYFSFINILIGNLLGTLPYSITITSHFIFTLYYSIGFFIGINIIGLLYQEENYFILFLPEGVPIWIIPILIIIEYLSYFARIFSLAIRLFANMMSGHVLIKILIGFSWNLITFSFFGKLISLVPLIIIFGVLGLELCIALLQSYVFIILIIIYLNDVVNTH